MDAIERAADPALRRRLMREHLLDLKQTLTRLHAMELQMIDAADRGRIVSDRDHVNRHRMQADLTAMLLEMVERAVRATSASR